MGIPGTQEQTVLAALRPYVSGDEHIEEATARRKLLLMGYEMHLAEQYRAGRLSLRDVATRLNRSLGVILE